MVIVITSTPQDIISYASGNGHTGILAAMSTPVFVIISIWLTFLAIYGYKTISGLNWKKSTLITLNILVPLLIVLFLFIVLESVQPF